MRPADLLADTSIPSTVPTFAEYVPVLRAAVRDGSRRAYGSYWNKILEQWGERRLDEPTVTEVQSQVEVVRSQAVVRSNGNPT